jgi:uncharacterized protein (DUF952 family)
MNLILHITQQTEWAKAKAAGVYHGDTLATEGFIHCSTPAQVLGPANALFRGQPGLVLLCINPDKVEPPLSYEDCYAAGQAFPHIYGPLNLDAVVQVIAFPPNADGTFSLPPEIMMNT